MNWNNSHNNFRFSLFWQIWCDAASESTASNEGNFWIRGWQAETSIWSQWLMQCYNTRMKLLFTCENFQRKFRTFRQIELPHAYMPDTGIHCIIYSSLHCNSVSPAWKWYIHMNMVPFQLFVCCILNIYSCLRFRTGFLFRKTQTVSGLRSFSLFCASCEHWENLIHVFFFSFSIFVSHSGGHVCLCAMRAYTLCSLT